MPPRRTLDIRLATQVDAGPKDVYRALTSARQLCCWWLERAETDARSMGRLRMVWAPQGRRAGREARGVFVDLEPGSKVAWLLEPKWRRKGEPALSSFFIEEHGKGSMVTVVQAGFSAAKSGQSVVAGARTGWEDCLGKLKLYLEEGRVCKNALVKLEELS
jgi:uncharacterized protein YndB with AHSA1/START domain